MDAMIDCSSVKKEATLDGFFEAAARSRRERWAAKRDLKREAC
jgi:hypothetical protein